MGRSRERTPSSPLHRRWGSAWTSPPATPPSPPSPAASSGSSSPERNEQVQAAVQQRISSLNDNLLNFLNHPMARNALMQAHEELGEEIAHLRAEIQNTKEDSLTISQNIDRLRDIIRTSEMNYQLLLSQLPPVQGNNGHGHGPTNELESTGSGNQAMTWGEQLQRIHAVLLSVVFVILMVLAC
ncbi:hypothetical protein C2845_PM03G23260 [Panicum miliaceum]|uniref:Uncharacterized protein n=1 Tax=Panicum miliaceum TaxID=4540 RepID=A0A3L6TC03_PANMI|nr:hypothetical protein C2845_PM03G23260 [Panicum miliaceum]